MVTRLNTKLLFVLALIVVALGAGIYFLHEYQNQNSALFKDQATQSKKQGDIENAIELMTRYVRSAPDDLDALKQLGDWIDELPPTASSQRRAYKIYSDWIRAVRDDPEVPETRFRLVQLMMSLGEFSQAENQIATLLRLTETNEFSFDRAHLLYLQGQCEAAQEKSAEALASMLAAIADTPQRVEFYEGAISHVQTIARIPNKEQILVPSVKQPRGPLSEKEFGELEEEFAKLQEPEEEDADFSGVLMPHTPLPAELLAFFPDESPTQEASPDTSPEKPDHDLVRYLLEQIDAHVEPKLDGCITRAEFFLRSGGDFEEIETKVADELAKLRAELADMDDDDREQAESKALVLESRFSFFKAGGLEQRGNSTEAHDAILEAEQAAKTGIERYPLELRFYLLLANSSLHRFAEEEAKTALLDSLAALKSALGKVPQKREVCLELENLNERDQEFLRVLQLESDLRATQIQAALTLLESDLFEREQVKTHLDPDSKEPKKDAEQVIEKYIRELEQLTTDDGVLAFLRARLQYARLQRKILDGPETPSTRPSGEQLLSWGAVAEELRGANLKVQDRPNYRRMIDLMLSRCYQELTDDEARVAHFQQVVEYDPNWRRGRLELARALRDRGDFENAIHEYRFSKMPVSLSEIAHVQIEFHKNLPPGERNWAEIDAQLTELRKLDPEELGLRLLHAEVKAQQGVFDDADQILEETLALPDLSREQQVELWKNRIRMRLLRNNVSSEVANLESANRLLGSAREALGDCVELDLIELMIAQHELMIAERNSDEKALKEKALEEKAGRIEQSLQQIEDPEKVDNALETIAVTFETASQPAKAIDIRKQVVAHQPESLLQRLLLCNAALTAEDDAIFHEQLKAVREIEGQDGPQGNLLEARWHAGKFEQEASKGTESDEHHLDAALELLNRLESQRPRSATVYVLQGFLAGLAQKEFTKFERYQKAIDLGATHPEISEFVTAYLEKEGRTQELIEISKRLKQERPQTFTHAMQTRQAQAYFQQESMRQTDHFLRDAGKKSAELAEGYEKLNEYQQLEGRDPNHPNLEGILAEAEQHFQRATKVEPENEQAWKGLVYFYLKSARIARADRAARIEKARDTIQQAETRLPDSPPELKPMTLADCYEMLGDLSEVTGELQRAARLAPDNWKVHQRLAEHAAHIDDRELEKKHLKMVLHLCDQDSIKSDAADRLKQLDALGILTYAAAVKSIRQLENSLPDVSDPTARLRNLKTQRKILRQFQVRDAMTKLVIVLEQINAIDRLSVAERLEQVRLYKILKRNDEAAELLASLLADNPDDLLGHAYAAEHYINYEDFSAARQQIDLLRDRLPDGFMITALEAELQLAQQNAGGGIETIRQYVSDLPETAPAEVIFYDSVSRNTVDTAFGWLSDLESAQGLAAQKGLANARVFLQDGRLETALRELKPLLDQEDVQKRYLAQCVRDCSRILAQFKVLAEAEQVYRRFLQMTDDQNARVQLIGLMGAQGKVEEAVQLGESIFNDSNAALVMTKLLVIMRTQHLDETQQHRIKSLLDQALEMAPNDLQLLLQRADYQDFVQDFDAAEQTYFRLVTLYPRHPVVLNNFAWLLSMRKISPQRSEQARKMVEQAIGFYGPSVVLLDTKATIEMSEDRYEEAIRLLDRCLKGTPFESSAAIYFLHLSKAQLLAGQEEEARESYQKAISAGLDPLELHPLEKEQLEKIKSRLIAGK